MNHTGGAIPRNHKERGIYMVLSKDFYEKSTLEELTAYVLENADDAHTYDDMGEMVKKFIDRDCIAGAKNIIDALDENRGCKLFMYDYSMGALETPKAIRLKEDLEQYVE